MTSLQVSTVLAAVAVRNMDAAVGWYRLFLGRDPDSRPMPPLADWNFPGNYTLQVVQDPDRAGGSLVTLQVADIGAARDELAGRGIELTVDDTASDNVRFGRVTDPDGNCLTLIEPKAGFDPQAAGGPE